MSRNSKALMAKCFQMTMSGDENHLSGQNWMFNAGPALSLNRESSVGAFDRSTGTEPFRLFIRLAPAFFGSGLNLDFSNISVHRGRESEKDIVLQ
jgi:hypothetical protein